MLQDYPTSRRKQKAMSSDRKILRQTLHGVLALILVFAGVVSYHMVTTRAGNGAHFKSSSLFSVGAQSPSDLPPINSPTELSNVFRTVSRRLKPAVVSLNVTEKVDTASMFRFGKNHPAIPGFPDLDEDGAQPLRRGTGSGFIVSEDGYIITNNHVVGKAEKIEVRLSDGKTYTAKLIGADANTDVAVIKINPKESLPHVALSSPEEEAAKVNSMEQGDWVIAIGSPFGLEQTITAGIVSATGRDLPQGSQYSRYIQTDASINPGNSGGPLINLRGEVIGMNTMIFTESGGNQGVGFAIPSDLVTKIARKLMTTGRVQRGWLGVSLYPRVLTEDEAKAIGLPDAEGALIQDLVADNSPAAQAGLKSGDFIVEFNGKPIKSGRDLTSQVADAEVGRDVEVKFLRDGKEQSAKVKLAERPDDDQMARGITPDSPGKEAKLGVSSTPVTPEMAQQMKLRIANGALIQSVTPGSPADESGLQRGDVVHTINRQPVTNTDDLIRIVKELPTGSTAVLQVERVIGGRATMLFLTVNF